MSFEVNGDTTTENVGALNVAPNGTASYTFTATADLSAAGSHTINAWTSLAGDSDTGNDMASTVAVAYTHLRAHET